MQLKIASLKMKQAQGPTLTSLHRESKGNAEGFRTALSIYFARLNVGKKKVVQILEKALLVLWTLI